MVAPRIETRRRTEARSAVRTIDPGLIGGGFTGIAAWTVSYPFDVVKSRYQASRDHVYKGVWDCAVKSFRNEGWQVFTRGFLPCTLRAVPTNAFTYPVYALLKRTFDTPIDDDTTVSSKVITKSKLTTTTTVSPQSISPIQSM